MDKRDRLRNKQDKLLALAAKNGICESLHLTNHPASPRLEQLRQFIYPDWETSIDSAINDIS